jgi:phospholipid-binding lipoprotein MlaA
MPRQPTAAQAQRRSPSSFPRWSALGAVTLALYLGLSGCATLPSGKPDPRDRFERFNRTVYVFNSNLDHALLRPVARGYVKVIPQPIRTAVNNFLTNLAYPSTIVNQFLQGNIKDGASDTARLVVNTSLGLGGLFDPATPMGLDRHGADFGQTLGKWGAHSGPYLMLPLLGPSTVRDGIGLVPDWLLLHEIETVKLFRNNGYVEWSLFAVSLVNLRAQLLDVDRLLDSAYDPYAFVRSAYLQRRDYLINGGAVTPEEEFPDTGDAGDAPPPAPGKGAPAAAGAPAATTVPDATVIPGAPAVPNATPPAPPADSAPATPDAPPPK